MNITPRSLSLLTLLLAASAAMAQPPGFSPPGGSQFFDSRDRVETEVLSPFTQVPRGSEFPIAIVFEMDHNWHIWTQPGGTPEGVNVFEGAINTEFVVTSTDTASLTIHEGFIQWPEPLVASVAGMGDLAVFEGRAIAYLPVTIPDDAPLGEATLTIALTFQTCDDKTCLAPTWDHDLQRDDGQHAGREVEDESPDERE